MYQGTLYPNYLSGTGYVMSRDVVSRLYQAALKTPLFHLEDVYLTGLCAHAAGIRPRHHPAFTYNKRKLDACLYKDKTVITSHRVNSSELRKVSCLTESYVMLEVDSVIIKGISENLLLSLRFNVFIIVDTDIVGYGTVVMSLVTNVFITQAVININDYLDISSYCVSFYILYGK
jgi:hypothetical protein